MPLVPPMRRKAQSPVTVSDRRVRIAKFGMYLAGFMAVVNISVIYLALPSIERALHAGIADQQWILSIYPLMEGGFTLAAGTLGDLYGRKRVMTAVVLLTLPSTEESKRDPALRIDGIGQTLSILSFLAICFALIEGNERGWSSPLIVGAFILSVAAFAIFLYAEGRVAQPMIHL